MRIPTEDETLAFANELIDHGVPVIVCKPDPKGTDAMIPTVPWSNVTTAPPCRRYLADFVYGTDALALIGGHGVDLIDVDIKAGGSIAPFGDFRHHGVTATPSGGRHYVVTSTGQKRRQGVEIDGQHVGDYIGGTGDHGSRMIGYLPGSARPAKYGDTLYGFEEEWDVEGAVFGEPDPQVLAVLDKADEPEPDAYVDDSPERDPSLGVHPYARKAVDDELKRLDDLPHPWAPGSYWDNTTFEVACSLIRFANSGWTGYTLEQAEADLLAHAPADDQWGEREHRQKWSSATDAVGDTGRRNPDDPANDFDVVEDDGAREEDGGGGGGGGWAPVDLAATVAGLLDGTITRPEPTIGGFGDGCLFYAGRINGVHGDSTAGKTWTALVTAGQELAKGETVVYVDLEDSAAGVVSRLLDDLGVDADAVCERFVYLHPDEPLTPVAAQCLGALLDRLRPSLVVVDSTGEALAIEGANPNADEEVARWFRLLPRLAVRCGAAVLLLDHATKAGDNELWPIGSQRKRAAVTGAAYLQKVAVPFGRDQDGKAVLVCAKDRHGNYPLRRRVAALTVRAGAITLEPEASTTPAGDFRPTGLMERVSRALEAAAEPLTGRAVEREVGGNKKHAQDALAALVGEGYATRTNGPRGSHLHASVKPYREDNDAPLM